MLLFSVLFLTCFNACRDEETDYGTLAIEDITALPVGESREIKASFSKPEFVEDIVYTFKGEDISIEGNVVYARNADKTVMVMAETSHHSASFTVKTVSALTSDDKLTMENVNAWVGYPASQMFPKLNGQDISDRLLGYTYDKTKLEIDAQTHTVKALEPGRHTVTVSAGSGIPSFIFFVNAYEVDKSGEKYNTSPYDSYAKELEAKWKADGTDAVTTVFIGDSFFDVRYFWTDFYATYWGKDALCFGISSATSYDWEVYLDGWFGRIQPRNVVMHIGTNNIYDDFESEEEAVLSLQRMFVLMHGRMPATKVYYFGISQRNYDAEKIALVARVNEQMKSWCEERDWITYMDTPSKLTADMLRDGIHPKLEYYSVFTDELARTDINMADKDMPDDMSDITRTVGQLIGDNVSPLMYKGAPLADHYVLEGKIDMTEAGSNPHLCFSFKTGDYFAYRMLLWDANTEGLFRVGYAYNGQHVNGIGEENVPAYRLTPGETLMLDFKLAMADNNACLSINGEPVLFFVNATGTGTHESLGISTEHLGCRVHALTAVTQKADGEEYEKAMEPLREIMETHAGKPAGAYRL